MTIEEIKTVCFVGSGTMGCYNSVIAALAGYEVIVIDLSDEKLASVSARQKELSQPLVDSGLITADEVDRAIAQITLTSDLEQGLANADLVSESVFERLELKRQVHRDLESLCPKHTIITTNSSSLLVSEIESALDDGSRFAALHFYLGCPLVDIVGGLRTRPQVLDVLERYVVSLHCTPFRLHKEYPGYVFNALLTGLFVSAQLLVIEGIASTEDVDRAWMAHSKGALGPFALMDYIGINVFYDTWTDKKDKPHDQYLASKLTPLFQPYIDKGTTGMSAGEGYYQYPNARCFEADFLNRKTPIESLYKFMMVAVMQRSLLVKHAGVASEEDIDQTWKIGARMESGPFEVFNQWGETGFLAQCERLQSKTKILSEEEHEAVKSLFINGVYGHERY
jgi:3-hydroxybutyryl-CoA dehydrogenase